MREMHRKLPVRSSVGKQRCCGEVQMQGGTEQYGAGRRKMLRRPVAFLAVTHYNKYNI